VQGNDGPGKEGPGFGRPAYDLIYVHVKDPSTEIIYYGWTRKLPTTKNVYYQILDPLGNVAAWGQVANTSSDAGYIADNGIAAYYGPSQIAGFMGYNALELVPTMAGDYAIQFNVGSAKVPAPDEVKYYIHPFDVTVADISNPLSPQAINGRVFSYKWHLNCNSGTNEACMEFYTWTPDSLVMMMDMNRIQPWGYTVSFNSHGCTNTGDIAADRRSTTTVSAAVPEYRVFLNEPDEECYPTGTPGEVEYIEINTCGPTGDLCVVVQTTKPGELNVYIDLNGTGAYEEGTEDIYFPYATDEVGEICIPWDGIDGFGNHIADSAGGLIIVEFLAGIVHYPVYDPENHPYGFNCALIRPNTGLQPLMYYDNRNTPIGTHNLSGCVSGCNSWTKGKGDRVMVNTWLNNITSADTDVFVVSHLCPPIAYDDSTCTAGSSIQIPIMDNDSARTFPIDPSSIVLGTPIQGSGQIFYNPDVELFTYIPDNNDSTTLIVRYQLCDMTPEEMEGPLCDSATITVGVYRDCPNGVILDIGDFGLTAIPVGEDVRLQWPRWLDAEPYTFWVERSVDEAAFAVLGRLRGDGRGGGMYEYWDRDGPMMAQSVRYRVWALSEGGGNHLSEVVTLHVAASAQIPVQIYPNPASDELVISYHTLTAGQVEIFDVLGRSWYRHEVPAMGSPHQEVIPLHGWPAGWYMLKYRYRDGRYTLRLRVE